MSALLFSHPSYRPRLEPFMFLEPETPESKARAKAAQQQERTRVIASILAGFFDVDLRTCSSPVRVHYLNAAAVAMDMAEKGPDGL